MSEKIEMSLADIIKSNKKNRSLAGARGGQRKNRDEKPNGGSSRKNQQNDKLNKNHRATIKGRQGAGGIQKAKYSKPRAYNGGPKNSGIKKAIGNELAKLVVSNLGFDVSDADMKELFKEFGMLKKAAIHYDRTGRSLGSADIIFERRTDAIKAMKQYNSVPLDGRPMKIQFTTSDVAIISKISGFGNKTKDASVKNRLGDNSTNAQRNNKSTNTQNIGKSTYDQRKSKNQRGNKNTASNHKSRGGNKPASRRTNAPAKTKEELDAELDNYIKEVFNIFDDSL